MTVRAPASTRDGLLEAAREVFSGSGFVEASIADVVSRAGASVGSLYHHFGGKAELYLALFEDYQERQEARAAAAVRAARQSGQADPVPLFLEGSRAYLQGCWAERDLTRLFLAGGGPPGFSLQARRRYQSWTARNATLLQVDSAKPWSAPLVLVLTTAISEAGHEVAVCPDEATATRLSDDVLLLLGRIAGAP